MKKSSNSLDIHRAIVSSIRIDHAGYTAIYDRLIEAYEEVGTSPVPICIHLSGETRTGKSCVVKDFLDNFLPEIREDGRRQTVVYAVAPAKGTIKSVLERLLQGLGDPYWNRGTESNQTGRLLHLLKAVDCKMIVLDEFQHLADKSQKFKLSLVSDWLKTLVDTNDFGLIAVGLPTSKSVINANAQLAARFDATLTMPLFDWRDAALRVQFKGLLQAFEKQLHPFELPSLKVEDTAFRFFLATSGRVGLLAKLMDRAVKNAIRSNTTKIRLEDLQAAFMTSIWYATKFPIKDGPFLCSSVLDTRDALAEQVTKMAAQEWVDDQSTPVAVVSMGGSAATDANSVSSSLPPIPKTKKALKAELAKAL
ncbi:MAG: TniB family NTP-binding protein [Arenimonas sp.]